MASVARGSHSSPPAGPASALQLSLERSPADTAGLMIWSLSERGSSPRFRIDFDSVGRVDLREKGITIATVFPGPPRVVNIGLWNKVRLDEFLSAGGSDRWQLRVGDKVYFWEKTGPENPEYVLRAEGDPSTKLATCSRDIFLAVGGQFVSDMRFVYSCIISAALLLSERVTN